MSVRLRLALWYAVTLVAMVVAVGAIIWVQYGSVLRGTVDEALRARAEDVRLSMATTDGGRPETTDPAWVGIFAAVFSRAGTITVASRDTPPGLTPPPDGYHTIDLGPSGARYAVASIAGPDGSTVVAGRPLAQTDASLVSLAELTAVVGSLASGAAVVGGWWLAGRALRPVDGMVREADAIGMTDLGRRLVEPAARDEIGRLARTLNAMLDRVAEGVRREHRFLTAASHDLRTPIAALQVELELAATRARDPDAMLAAIRSAHADTVRLAALASDLLRLAEADPAGRELLRRPVRLRAIIDGVVARTAALARAKDIRVLVDAPDVTLSADRLRIEQALANLLSNAIRESVEHADVEVRADVRAAAGAGRSELVVDVVDRGPGVPAALQAHLFEPFGSGSPGSDGRTGLGLATAAASVRAHGGRIVYGDRPGGGAWFSFSVPIEAPSEEPAAYPSAAGGADQVA